MDGPVLLVVGLERRRREVAEDAAAKRVAAAAGHDVDDSARGLPVPNGTVNTTGRREADFGLTLGGPIVSDRLFFFAAFNPQYQRRTFIAPEGFPLRSLGDVNQDRRSLAYAGKLTWQLAPGHRIDASAFGDPSHGPAGPQRFTALAASDTSRFSELRDYATHSETLRYDGILSRSWLVEASLARAANSLDEVPHRRQRAHPARPGLR